MPDPELSMPERVAHQIEAMVLDGSLTDGVRLPSERKLCQRLNVSRSSLREALKELHARGIVESKRGSGSYVVTFQQAQPNKTLQKLLKDNPSTLDELLEARELLEGEVAYLAAKRATDLDLEHIRKAYEALVEIRHPDNAAEHAERDIAFHRTVYSAAHNSILLMSLNSTRDLMMSFIFDMADQFYAKKMSKRQNDTQHRRIYRAIERRDPAAAKRAARAHIHTVSEMLMTWRTKENKPSDQT